MNVESEVRPTPEQYTEKRDSQSMSEFGIAQRPVAPEDLVDKKGNVVARSVGDDTDTVETVGGAPYPTEKIKIMATEGDFSDSRRWFGAMWWRQIKRIFAK